MAEIVGSGESFAQGFVDAVAEVAVVLDERAHRLLLGAAARQLGRGGITPIAGASGASPDTVGRGAAELEAGVVADGRVRVRGAGRKSVEATDPELWPELEKLVDPETRGDPMSELRLTTKSTVKLADALGAQGHSVSPKTVARLLGDHGYSLRATTKTVEGTLLDTNTYEKGIKITDKQMRAFEAQHLQHHEFHGNWNNTVRDVQEQADQQTPRPTTGA